MNFFHNSFLNFYKLHENLINKYEILLFFLTLLYLYSFSQFIQISKMTSSTCYS